MVRKEGVSVYSTYNSKFYRVQFTVYSLYFIVYSLHSVVNSFQVLMFEFLVLVKLNSLQKTLHIPYHSHTHSMQ